jgi:hypothetical protein
MSDSDTASPSTHSVPYLAQEIIDNIIDRLPYDNDTLKRCSTVSRSFQVSTRRHLFYLIELDTIEVAVRFHRLLISTPDIAINIRQLHVRICHRFGEHMNGINEWYASAGSTLLAEILEIPPCLERLHWNNAVQLTWDELSSELRSALVKLFQRPSLTTITMMPPDGFPLSALHLSPVKRLDLYCVSLDKRDQGQVMLPHLETLKITPERSDVGEIPLLVPNLRQISCWEAPGASCALTQLAINASSRSLKRFWWFYGSFTSRQCK